MPGVLVTGWFLAAAVRPGFCIYISVSVLALSTNNMRAPWPMIHVVCRPRAARVTAGISSHPHTL